MESSNGKIPTLKSPSPKPVTNILSMSPTKPGSPLFTMSPGKTKAINMQKMIDEMRQHIAKLKGDLEAEKARNKQLHRDKVAEIKNVREICVQEKDRVMQTIQVRLQQEKQNEMQKLRDSLNKERDLECRQIMRYKDDEIKQVKTQLAQEKEDAIKVALELQKKAITDQRDQNSGPTTGNSALIVKLQREIKSIKDSKRELEEQLQMRISADAQKASELQKLKKEHEVDMAKVIKEYKQAAQKDMQELKKAEDTLQTKEHAVSQMDSLLRKVTLEKEELDQQLRELTKAVEVGASSVHKSRTLPGTQTSTPISCTGTPMSTPSQTPIRNLTSPIEGEKMSGRPLSITPVSQIMTPSMTPVSQLNTPPVTPSATPVSHSEHAAEMVDSSTEKTGSSPKPEQGSASPKQNEDETNIQDEVS